MPRLALEAVGGLTEYRAHRHPSRSCVEALEGGCRLVLVGDCGRPGRVPFLAALRAAGLEAEFAEVAGWAAVGERHDLISSRGGGSDGGPQSISVGLLRLEA